MKQSGYVWARMEHNGFANYYGSQLRNTLMKSEIYLNKERKKEMNDHTKSILFFNNMLTPKIITAIYWLCLLGSAVSGIGSMFSGGFSFGNFFMGLLIALGGAIGARIMCELMIVLFKMHEALQIIQSK